MYSAKALISNSDFQQYLLSIYCVTGTMLGIEDTLVNQQVKIPTPYGIYILVGEMDNK